MARLLTIDIGWNASQHSQAANLHPDCAAKMQMLVCA